MEKTMSKPTTIKGGKVRVWLGNNADPIVYTMPCGFTSRSISFNKGTSEEKLPNCDDPDKVNWLGRNATSLAMDIDGEGVLVEASVSTWLDAWENVEPVTVKVEWVFPGNTITWIGNMQVDSFKVTATDGETVKASVSMKSDGEMVRSKSPANNGNGGQ